MLRDGKPILVKAEDFNLSDLPLDIAIVYGKDLAALRETLAPFVGPNTLVEDHLGGTPEDAHRVNEGQHRGSL